MYANCRAFVVHRTPNRLRIKIPDWRHQEACFARLRQALLQHPEVNGVDVNPLAASLVIDCHPRFNLTGSESFFPGLEIQNAQYGSRQLTISQNDARALSTPDPGYIVVLVKLLVALATKQLSSQLIDWIVDALLHSASQRQPRILRSPQLPFERERIFLPAA